jgi:hypothetical protein
MVLMQGPINLGYADSDTLVYIIADLPMIQNSDIQIRLSFLVTAGIPSSWFNDYIVIWAAPNQLAELLVKEAAKAGWDTKLPPGWTLLGLICNHIIAREYVGVHTTNFLIRIICNYTLIDMEVIEPKDPPCAEVEQGLRLCKGNTMDQPTTTQSTEVAQGAIELRNRDYEKLENIISAISLIKSGNESDVFRFFYKAEIPRTWYNNYIWRDSPERVAARLIIETARIGRLPQSPPGWTMLGMICDRTIGCYVGEEDAKELIRIMVDYNLVDIASADLHSTTRRLMNEYLKGRQQSNQPPSAP